LFLCIKEWKHLCAIFFGAGNLALLAQFGKFIVLREQTIFFLTRVHKSLGSAGNLK
jgi:hypothetical protein